MTSSKPERFTYLPCLARIQDGAVEHTVVAVRFDVDGKMDYVTIRGEIVESAHVRYLYRIRRG